MNYQKFLEQLSSLYDDWGRDSVRPKSKQFQSVLNQVQGMTTANVMQLLNFAVQCMDPDEIYCEVGSFQGSTLIGALLDRPNRMGYAVDNFSEYDRAGKNLEILMKNLSEFDLEEQVYFCNQDFEEFFLELRSLKTDDRIGAYLYDGPHDYRSQLLGLLLVKPFLAEKALIIVDDSNWPTVRQANWDFMAAHPECELSLELLTPRDGHPTFWNGIDILSWDVSRRSNYPASRFRQQRQIQVVQGIYELQLLESNRQGIVSPYSENITS